MEHKTYSTLPPEAILIRREVFMEEQGFQNEFDDIDSMTETPRRPSAGSSPEKNRASIFLAVWRCERTTVAGIWAASF